MTAPDYAMANLDKCTKPVLLDMYQRAHSRGAAYGTEMPKAELQKRLAAMKAAYWNNSLQPKAKAPVAFKGITASDCNDWLATLPPAPLYGEVSR